MKIFIRETEDLNVKFVASDVENPCGRMQGLMNNKFFTAKCGEVFLSLDEEKPALFVGLGKLEDLTIDKIKTAALKAGQKLTELGTKKIMIKMRSRIEDINKQALAIVEGLLNSTYQFDNYKSEKSPKSQLEEINFFPKFADGVNEADFEELLIKWQGIIFARDLVNTPANDMTPSILAKNAKSLKEYGVDVKVFGKDEIEKIGMKAFLSVARGSNEEPKLIVMEYMKGEGDPIVLVGKGLTYDSGGYSLKPNDGMKTMKSDMGGSAAVIGAMKAISMAGLKKNVVAIVATCENMVDGGAYKPGDIIGSLKGLTIEVDNTDAEGRLTLADAVYYGEKNYKPKMLIDLATLTGACLVALGMHRSGVIGRCDKCVKRVLDAAIAEDEKAWGLPYGEEYRELNKSDIADIKNSGGRFGGSSSAGEFVGAFLEKTTPWAHIDIAGPAYNSAPYRYEPAGGTGHMVKTLFRIVKDS